MAKTLTFQTLVKDDANRQVATENDILSGDAVEEFSVVSPNGSDVTVPMTIDMGTVIGWWMVSDQDVTVEENAVPDYTTTMYAGVPIWWATGKGTNPITVDSTFFKFINAGGTDATVKGGFLTT